MSGPSRPIRRLREEAATLANALVLLTRLPVGGEVYRPERMARAVVYFPVVGALVGLAAAGVLVAAGLVLPHPVAVVLAVAVSVLVTGGLHEDGLADSVDSLGAGGDRERVRAILDDSRLGTFGALALVFAVALAIAALASLPVAAAGGALVAAHALGRWASVAVLWRLPYVSGPGGSGAQVASVPAGRFVAASLLAAAAAGLGFAWTALPVVALPAAGLAVLAAAAVGLHWRRTLDGVTGDGLGAACKLAEIAVYLAAASAHHLLSAP